MGKSTTNLAEKFPQLSLEWHPILNGVLTPCDVSPSGKMKVWWQCKQCNEPFEASLNNRSKDRGCPYCAGKRSNSNNNLEAKFPEVPADRVFIAKQLNFTVAQKVIGCLQELDSKCLFSDGISRYLTATKFQNLVLFKKTYDDMRKRAL